MRTISSTTLVGLIKASLSDSGTPSKTQSVLEAILALPAPAPTYRLELKRGLDVEQAASVLEVLVNWAEAWVAQNGKGIEWDVGGDASASISQSTLPSLESVGHSLTSFIICLLLLEPELTLVLGHHALVALARLAHSALPRSPARLPPFGTHASGSRTPVVHAGRLSRPPGPTRCRAHATKARGAGSGGKAKEEHAAERSVRCAETRQQQQQ